MTKGSEPYWELSGHSPVNTCNTKPNEAEKPVEAQLTAAWREAILPTPTGDEINRLSKLLLE